MKRVVDFIRRDIWRIRLAETPPRRSFLIRNLRVVLLAVRGFNENKCALHASALTFYTLLSIVPVFALAFGVAKGFGLERMLETQVLAKIPMQGDALNAIIGFSRTLLENTRGGLVAGVGVALLFWAVMKVLGNIERSFNEIWGVKRMRGWDRRVADYLSVMLICPILLVAASSVTVLVTTRAQAIAARIGFLGPAVYLAHALIGLFPYTILWFVFSFLYIFIPNTRVNVASGILGGVAAGTLYQVVQWIYVHFQVGVAQYNAIYGSFAALPLFLVWLQTSWTIILFGAEVSFAHQNVDTYEFEPDCLQVSRATKRLLSLWLVSVVAKGFTRGERPKTAEELSHETGIPIRLAREMLFELVESGVLASVSEEGSRAPAYQPAVDVGLLSVARVTERMEGRGPDTLPLVKTREFERIAESLRGLEKELERSPANIPLKDI